MMFSSEEILKKIGMPSRMPNLASKMPEKDAPFHFKIYI